MLSGVGPLFLVGGDSVCASLALSPRAFPFVIFFGQGPCPPLKVHVPRHLSIPSTRFCQCWSQLPTLRISTLPASTRNSFVLVRPSAFFFQPFLILTNGTRPVLSEPFSRHLFASPLRATVCRARSEKNI